MLKCVVYGVEALTKFVKFLWVSKMQLLVGFQSNIFLQLFLI